MGWIPIRHLSYGQFQPFLRFYATALAERCGVPPNTVSTLLEILPLMLGGFLGF